MIGLEADAQYADLSQNGRTSSVTVPASIDRLGAPLFSPAASIERVNEPGRPPDIAGLRSVTFVSSNQFDRGVEWFGTVRGRLGNAVDKVLLYGTGGFAYGASGRGDGEIRTGWVGGGGIEYALAIDNVLNFFHASAVTIKVEGLYVSLDRPNVANVLYAVDQSGNTYYAPASAVSSGSRNSHDDFIVARAGLNYKF